MSQPHNRTIAGAPLRVSDAVTLRRWTLADAEPLFQLVDENREFLGEWLAWVGTYRSAQQGADFIQWSLNGYADGSTLNLALDVEGALAGGMGFDAISAQNRHGEIGYWLAERYTGRGHATAARHALVEHAFGPLGLHRITIWADTANRASRAIPERLGFHFEGIEREAQLRHGTFFDLARYSMLGHEWAP